MKHKKKIKHPLKKLMRGNILIVLLFVIVAFGVLLTSGAMVNKSAVDKTEQFGEAEVSSESGKQNLQLKTLKFKPKPTPNDTSCNHDNGKTNDPNCNCPQASIECKDKKCIKVFKSGMIPNPPPDGDCQKDPQHSMFDGWCQSPYLAPKDGVYCLGKPVIYLYPTRSTLVSVTVKTEGKIVVSDPLYPPNGWKQILAHPDGTLFYLGKQYRELFYESETRELKRPKAGIVIKSDELETKLLSFIKTLGLTRQDEQQEFLDWWIPKLENLNSPYIFVSILDSSEKKRLDNVEIIPKPDTFIDFVAYFEPRQTDKNPNSLVLPQTPKRLGFTAIEWGGVIGR